MEERRRGGRAEGMADGGQKGFRVRAVGHVAVAEVTGVHTVLQRK